MIAGVLEIRLYSEINCSFPFSICFILILLLCDYVVFVYISENFSAEYSR